MRESPHSIATVETPAIVVGDLHLGSKYCHYEALADFLDSWSTPVSLILNGDTLDAGDGQANLKSEKILRDLRQNRTLRPFVITGNHDEDNPRFSAFGFAAWRGVRMPQLGVYICHGDQFHVNHPHHRLFIRAFHTLHRIRVRLGAPPVHVAEYAKRWQRFYSYLRRAVRDNAVEFARENGYQTVVCGHVHFAEDRLSNGVRYINTGCWTESPAHFLSLQEQSISLQTWPLADQTAEMPKHV